MTRAINFKSEVSSENITELIAKISEWGYDGSELNLYISSEGGDPDSTPPLIHLINQRTAEGEIITIFGYGQISSAAFDIFRLCDCEKQLLPGTYALIHKTKLEIDELSKIHLEQKKVAKQQDEELYQFLKESKVIPINDLKNFNQGKDIIVSYDRLCKLLKVSL